MFAELRAKYEEMRELRRTDDGSYDPRERMVALATQFPGALREIDTLPMDEIEHRIEALSKAERDPSHAMPWMKAQSRFHELTREALRARRAEGELEGEALEREKRERKALDGERLRHARPELALTPQQAKALVFTPRV